MESIKNDFEIPDNPEKIEISNDIFDNDAKYFVSKLLSSNASETLKQLAIRYIDLSDDKIFSICQLLPKLKKLETLSLSGNSIGPKGGSIIASMLKTPLPSLTSLDLFHNRIGNAATLILNNLYNSKLRYLGLTGNTITANCAVDIKNYLIAPECTLLELCLDKNNLEDEGAIFLAQGIANNDTLRRLQLGSNEITDEGAIAIANALEINTTLRAISLGNNKFTFEGCKAIIEASVEHPVLLTVNLRKNILSAEEVDTLNNFISNVQRPRITIETSIRPILKAKRISLVDETTDDRIISHMNESHEAEVHFLTQMKQMNADLENEVEELIPKTNFTNTYHTKTSVITTNSAYNDSNSYPDKFDYPYTFSDESKEPTDLFYPTKTTEKRKSNILPNVPLTDSTRLVKNRSVDKLDANNELNDHVSASSLSALEFENTRQSQSQTEEYFELSGSITQQYLHNGNADIAADSYHEIKDSNETTSIESIDSELQKLVFKNSADLDSFIKELNVEIEKLEKKLSEKILLRDTLIQKNSFNEQIMESPKSPFVDSPYSQTFISMENESSLSPYPSNLSVDQDLRLNSNNIHQNQNHYYSGEMSPVHPISPMSMELQSKKSTSGSFGNENQQHHEKKKDNCRSNSILHVAKAKSMRMRLDAEKGHVDDDLQMAESVEDVISDETNELNTLSYDQVDNEMTSSGKKVIDTKENSDNDLFNDDKITFAEMSPQVDEVSFERTNNEINTTQKSTTCDSNSLKHDDNVLNMQSDVKSPLTINDSNQTQSPCVDERKEIETNVSATFSPKETVSPFIGSHIDEGKEIRKIRYAIKHPLLSDTNKMKIFCDLVYKNAITETNVKYEHLFIDIYEREEGWFKSNSQKELLNHFSITNKTIINKDNNGKYLHLHTWDPKTGIKNSIFVLSTSKPTEYSEIYEKIQLKIEEMNKIFAKKEIFSDVLIKKDENHTNHEIVSEDSVSLKKNIERIVNSPKKVNSPVKLDYAPSKETENIVKEEEVVKEEKEEEKEKIKEKEDVLEEKIEYFDIEREEDKEVEDDKEEEEEEEEEEEPVQENNEMCLEDLVREIPEENFCVNENVENNSNIIKISDDHKPVNRSRLSNSLINVENETCEDEVDVRRFKTASTIGLLGMRMAKQSSENLKTEELSKRNTFSNQNELFDEMWGKSEPFEHIKMEETSIPKNNLLNFKEVSVSDTITHNNTTHHDQVGFIPSKTIATTKPLSIEPQRRQKRKIEIYLATFDYSNPDTNYLNFKEGDLLQCIGEKRGWMICLDPISKKKKLAPLTYLKKL
eukprot:TRINITY_DN3120_c0_g5_i1.p1 TRINITY_DN3120_c0_g5~~TRINITY_DN3120_c0_g5_i1.p1  ORF type:complete len:1309 (+),score=457.36 TRINITY_DN3120_c0_g5_i1:37-3927(+)